MYKFLDDVNSYLQEMFDLYEIEEKSRNFYKSKVQKFFNTYMNEEDKAEIPLDAITYYHINTYLFGNYIPKDAVNSYFALKRFFNYCYTKKYTKDVMVDVEQPVKLENTIVYLSDEEYIKLKKYITDENNDLETRLILGLFIFTGLSRRYIHGIRKSDFHKKEGLYYLKIWTTDTTEIILPLKSELQLIIQEYLTVSQASEPNIKVTSMDENYLSTFIGLKTKEIVGRKYSPTVLSSTFIALALRSGNDVWEISKLILEKITTIEKHLDNNGYSNHKLLSILNSF